MTDGRHRVLIIDGYNFLHRARSGFTAGDYAVVFNFFRNLRALLEKEPADRVLFVTEGVPVARLTTLPEYKANRTIDPADEKAVAAMGDFHRQKNIVLRILAKSFPLVTVRHRDYECDDVIYTIVKHGSPSIDYTIVSTDTDFIQMLQEFANLRIYNPTTKQDVEAPEYDYVLWKSLRGDATDNVPGLDGVGDKTAEELASDTDKMKSFLLESPERVEQFSRNASLIKLAEICEDEEDGWESTSPERDWDVVKLAFDEMKFASMLKEPYWSRFVATFDPLWGSRAVSR